MTKFTRRRFLHLSAGVAALPIVSRIAMAQSNPSPPRSAAPLAERLAAYAHALRYEDLDPTTVERVKVHVIDTIGCGRPGTQMPAWLFGAYTEIPCYGVKGPAPLDLDRVPVPSVEEVAALVDYMLAKVVKRTCVKICRAE